MNTIRHEVGCASNPVECLQGDWPPFKSAGCLARAQEYVEPHFPICVLKIIDLMQYYGIDV